MKEKLSQTNLDLYQGNNIAYPGISLSMIKYIENWINNYPRRIFGYRTANEVKVA